jgi:hypothetical protein
MIPNIFNEESELLSDSNLNSLKRHYMKYDWKVRNNFLDDIEDSMSHDSLIGSRNNVEGHYGQIGAGYLFDSSFQEAYFYLERVVDCYVDFLDELLSAYQIKKYASALYGALLSACQSGVGRRILMENRDKQDSIRSWCHLVQQYETDGNRHLRIKRLESVINTVFHFNYRIIGKYLSNGSKTMKMPSQN